MFCVLCSFVCYVETKQQHTHNTTNKPISSWLLKVSHARIKLARYWRAGMSVLTKRAWPCLQSFLANNGNKHARCLVKRTRGRELARDLLKSKLTGPFATARWQLYRLPRLQRSDPCPAPLGQPAFMRTAQNKKAKKHY